MKGTRRLDGIDVMKATKKPAKRRPAPRKSTAQRLEMIMQQNHQRTMSALADLSFMKERLETVHGLISDLIQQHATAELTSFKENN